MACVFWWYSSKQTCKKLCLDSLVKLHGHTRWKRGRNACCCTLPEKYSWETLLWWRKTCFDMSPKECECCPTFDFVGDILQQRKSVVCISGKWYRACQHVKEIHVSFCEVAYDQTHVLHEIFVERERPLKLVIWTNGGLCSLQGLSWWHKDMGKRMKKPQTHDKEEEEELEKRWKRKKMISRNSYFHSFFWL